MPTVHTMNRQQTYPYQQPQNHRYSGTSSAFSASANPNEDWTKISDLAERRRIQNRIAQRNYRKKLKKRLEDLERRAASSSASPETKPADLKRPGSQSGDESLASDTSLDVPMSKQDRRTPDAIHAPYLASTGDDRGMFTHQYTRQLSTSPPPFSYSTYPTEAYYSTYPAHSAYPAIAYSTPEMPSYSPYLPPLSSAYTGALPSVVHPMKQDPYYGDDEMNPFSMSYASMAGIDMSAQSYQDAAPHTPPLSDTFDHSSSGSPPESTLNFPITPASMPGTPPLRML